MKRIVEENKEIISLYEKQRKEEKEKSQQKYSEMGYVVGPSAKISYDEDPEAKDSFMSGAEQ